MLFMHDNLLQWAAHAIALTSGCCLLLFVCFVCTSLTSFAASLHCSGNTALHMCIYHDQKDMYDFLVEYLCASESVRNVHGSTPIVLAAELGKLDMFQHIYNKRRRAFYTFGKVCGSGWGVGWCVGWVRGGGGIHWRGGRGNWLYMPVYMRHFDPSCAGASSMCHQLMHRGIVVSVGPSWCVSARLHGNMSVCSQPSVHEN